MRIHQHRFSYLEKEDTFNYIEKIRGISVNVPSFYCHDDTQMKNAKKHPLYKNLSTEVISNYDVFFKTSRQFDVSEQVIIDSFLINGVVGILPKELSNKLLNYHQQSYIYNAPVFQFDKTSEKGIIVSWQKTLHPCGVVALLLRYFVKKANKIHSPETSFGGFTSISEVA